MDAQRGHADGSTGRNHVSRIVQSFAGDDGGVADREAGGEAVPLVADGGEVRGALEANSKAFFLHYARFTYRR